MQGRFRLTGLVVLLVGLFSFGVQAKEGATGIGSPELMLPREEVAKRLARYAPADICPAPGRKIDARTLALVKKLGEATAAIDLAFWEQVSEDGLQILGALAADPTLKDYADLVRINYGPWDRLANQDPIVGREPKPEGANFYPQDLSRRELERWIETHPNDKEAFTSAYTVIRRKETGLIAIPYSQKYGQQLGKAAAALREAALLTDCPGLAKYLLARADAFLSNDYFPSEMLWMDTGECPVEIAIGPYEFYEDRLMGYKTSFTAVIAIKDYAESAKFAKLSQYAEELVGALPLPEEMKGRVEQVKASPIVIANEVSAAGDFRAGFQPRAYILPNDERVKVAKGTKHVILKNVVNAKFQHLLYPLARQVIAEDQVPAVNAESYFNFLLLWQLAHGLTPKLIALPGGGEIHPRMLLRQRYGIVEATRAEAVALLNAMFLIDKRVFPESMRTSIPVTYLASVFENLRLGPEQTHGLSKLIVYNYLAAAEAIRYDPTTRRFHVALDKLPGAVRSLAIELLTIEITGDYDWAGKMVVDYGIVPAEIRTKLNDLAGLPIDILPRYTLAP